MRIARANNEAIKYACMNYHYAKAIPVNTIGYNVYNGDEQWCGVVLYGTGANKCIGSEYNIPQGGVVELVRVALNGKQECTSQAVAMSLKQLHKDCPLVHMVVSYADCDQKHLGTIYQATNWIYTGTNNKGTLAAFIVHGKKTHKKSIYSKIVVIDGKKQHCPQTIDAIRKYIDPKAECFYTECKRKYLFPFDKQLKKELMKLAKPYPKNDDWVKIDRSQFKHNEETEK